MTGPPHCRAAHFPPSQNKTRDTPYSPPRRPHADTPPQIQRHEARSGGTPGPVARDEAPAVVRPPQNARADAPSADHPRRVQPAEACSVTRPPFVAPDKASSADRRVMIRVQQGLSARPHSSDPHVITSRQSAETPTNPSAKPSPPPQPS